MSIPASLRNTCSDSPLYKAKVNKKVIQPPRIPKISDDTVRDIRVRYQLQHQTIPHICKVYSQISKYHINRIINYEVRAKIDIW